MGHYAKIDSNNTVVEIIVAESDFFDNYIDTSPGKWIKTSYNIKNGVYLDPKTNEPHSDQDYMISLDEGRQRKNFAGIEDVYDEKLNAFISPRPYNSWILNEDTCVYEAPILYPNDGKQYEWNEETQTWDLLENE